MASLSAQGYLTCIACRMVFKSPGDQRLHYQSDLHRFNLRRQATNLPPISAEVFQEKVQQQRAEDEQKRDKHNFFCSVCNKSFGSENTFKQHNTSRKHLDRARKEGTPVSSGAPSTVVVVPSTEDVPEVEKTEQELIDEKIQNAVELELEHCLFCSVVSTTLEANLNHMAYEHGFFIPHIEYVDDIEGLVEYLGEKVGTGNTCLMCNKMFKTFEGVQQHMVMSNHCRLKWDNNEDEYLDWYDWDRKPDSLEVVESSEESSTEPSGDNDDTTTTLTTDTSSEVSSESSRKQPTLAASGYAMVLPDGSMIGHRELATYYKQRFRREETRDSVLIRRLISQYNTLGFVNPVGKFQTSVMKQTERRDQHWFQKRDMQLGVKANKFQKHRRVQIIF